MGHYAKVINGLVVDIMVATPEFIEKKDDPWYVEWVETSYNVRGGVYYDNTTGEPHKDQSLINKDPGRKRKNFCAVGDTYDKKKDAFIPPTPFPSWILNEDTCLWEAPIPIPDDAAEMNGNKRYAWNESKNEWTYTGFYFENGEIKTEGK